MNLFEDDESWTPEALDLTNEFRNFATAFLKKHSEDGFKVRELGIIMQNAIQCIVIEAALNKRLR